MDLNAYISSKEFLHIGPQCLYLIERIPLYLNTYNSSLEFLKAPHPPPRPLGRTGGRVGPHPPPRPLGSCDCQCFFCAPIELCTDCHPVYIEVRDSLNGIFDPCTPWARGLARWKNCRRVVVGVTWNGYVPNFKDLDQI